MKGKMIYISDQTHKYLKVLAILEDSTIKEVVTKMIAEKVKQNQEIKLFLKES